MLSSTPQHFLEPLKTPENERFSDVFRRYGKCCRIQERFALNGTICTKCVKHACICLLRISTYHFLLLILAYEQHPTVRVYPYWINHFPKAFLRKGLKNQDTTTPNFFSISAYCNHFKSCKLNMYIIKHLNLHYQGD